MVTELVDREVVAGRLLAGSVRKSYDPVVDIAWDEPLDPDKYFLPPQIMSLYGTELWDRMTREQQREMSRQELANVVSVGIWFENVLNRILLRELLSDDPTSRNAHYTLTEMGDECRHMVMFGTLIGRIEARPYWPRGITRLAVGLLPMFLRGPSAWAAALLGEEIFDAIQRQIIDDPELQPMVSRVMRVHVTEEARHMQFAREALARRAPNMPWYEKYYGQLVMALGAPVFLHAVTNRHMYRRAGLKGGQAKRIAWTNPNFEATRQTGAADLVQFLDRVGLMGRGTRWMWRRCGGIA